MDRSIERQGTGDLGCETPLTDTPTAFVGNIDVYLCASSQIDMLKCRLLLIKIQLKAYAGTLSNAIVEDVLTEYSTFNCDQTFRCEIGKLYPDVRCLIGIMPIFFATESIRFQSP